MTMFWEFLRFELRFRMKSVSTYVYFCLWFAVSFFCVASESFGPVSNSNGKVLLNGPYANTLNDTYAAFFGTIVIAAIFGTAVLRDFQRDTYQLLFTKPISKFAYLGGRWAGSFITTVLVFTGMLVGTWLATFAPWADRSRIGPNHIEFFLQPFLSIVVVQIFFQGSLYFAIAALTRKLFVVYLQGVALFMLYVVGITIFSATRSLEHFWSGVLDPVGLLMVDRITRYWSVVEKNTQLLQLDFSGYSPGVFLINRLLWLGIGVLALCLVAWRFPLSVEALTAKAQGRRAAKARALADGDPAPRASSVPARLPRVTQDFGWRSGWACYVTLCRLRIKTILKELPFWAIVGVLAVFAANNGHFAGRLGGTNVWPVTYLMLQAVEGSATLFFFIVAGLYAAELIWRERDHRFDGIHDALPLSELADWLSKLTAICVIEILLLAVTLGIGVLMQTLDGYHRYEISQYLRELYLVTFPQIVGFALFALFVHTLVSNKFVGHGLVIGLVVLQSVLFSFGWENTLYLPGVVPQYIYSDMNGYGHFVAPLAGAIAYWLAIFSLLGVMSIAYARRGPEDDLRARTRLAWQRAPGLAFAALCCLAAAIGCGGWYYYNAHVLNEYLDSQARRQVLAGYERDFKRYQDLVQPKVTAVDSAIDIFPERRAFEGDASLTLQNKSSVPISQIHLTDAHDSATQIQFDRPFHQVSRTARNLYSVYELTEPLAPGEVVKLTFHLGHESPGFKDGGESAEFAYNGTFFDSEFFPQIGYDANLELDDPRRRREQHLGALAEMAVRGDPQKSRVNLFTPNADWIRFHTVVSTSDDQIAIAPGTLKKEWHDRGRRYFEYSLGNTPTLDLFAFLSGRYAVRREVYAGLEGPIQLEVYHEPAHTYNVDSMLAATRAGLEYLEREFSPYQFDQFRIMEFPRYRTFAQSFANTVPFSESIGFITRVAEPTDVDLTYFVTAHELAHQWWGHQVVGGLVEGSNMLSETLAEYSAYMVMQKRYGKDYMHRVMHHFLDRYLRGRAGEVRRERPLALVQREIYVWYEKGGQILYSLADYIGEEKVNRALRKFLLQYRYANATADGNAATGGVAYPDTRALVAALAAETPADMQYLIEDGFNQIVLYDNKVLAATSKRLPDGRYQVTLDVQARKVRADGNGAETAMPLADYIEIGVFMGKKDAERPLYLKRERMTAAEGRYTVIVNQRPTRAGIDPYNKLIDRLADDNLMDITED